MRSCTNRILSATVGVLAVVLLLPAPAGAVQSPPGCNANTFAITMSRSASQAVPGQIVTFGVSVEVPLLDGSGTPACDTANVTINAQCPDAGNNVPPTTTVQNLVTGANFLAGTPPTSVGSINCVMPVVPVNTSISAFSEASGLLLDTDLLEGSPFTGTKTITVTVTPCQVKVDKQVSCDGGATWVDPGLVLNNEDGTLDCAVIGLSGPVQVRYQAANTGSCALTECVLTDTNGTFGTPPDPGNLAPGQTTDFLPAVNTPACSDAFGNPENPNEPDTATITCQTGGTPVTASDTASFSCLAVDLTVDRAVNCGPGFADNTQVRANDDTTLGCTAVDGDPVNWKYKACNAGTAPLYACTLVDQNLIVSAPISVGNLAAGVCSADLPSTGSPQDCSTALEASEVPDLGKVTLTCCTTYVASLIDCVEANRVSVYDVSTVTCSTPSGLDVVKQCVDTDLDGTDDNVRVVASATSGDIGFENCTAADVIYRDGECPPTGTGDSIPLTPEGGVTSPFSLAPGGQQGLFGTIDPALLQDACNTASVTCTIAGTETSVTAEAAPVTCNFQEGEGCFTRTPGFWATHPGDDARIGTFDFLPQTVCGTELDNVFAGNGNSAIEAMGSVGKDHKILGSQLTQLVRQCTAAYLNVAATLANGGDCSSETNIETLLGACCDEESICTGVDSGVSINACISALDEFNNSPDTLDPDAFNAPGPANSSYCRDAKNNGVVVHPTP
jgi:hypothetical protein